MDKKTRLREKAENLLRKKGIKPSLYQKDLESLVEELSIFQIELEQQNEELKKYQTELEKTKNKYTSLFNSAPMGYLLLDENMLITEINNTACTLLKGNSATIIGKRFNSLVHTDSQNLAHFCRMNLEKNQNINCDLKLNRLNNESFYARIVGTPDKTNTIDSVKNKYLIAIIDVSVEKKLESKLKKETEVAQRNEKLKSVFLANMSHEIRTPLNGIMGFSELLTQPNLEQETIQNYANIINNSGNRLLNLINNVLEISKIESGSVDINKEKFNLVDELNNVVKLFEANAQKKGIKIIQLFDPEDPSLKNLYSDKIKISQIVSNLINNAVKFTDEGIVSINVKIQNMLLQFEVKDSGSGIKEEIVKKLFNRYYQDPENQKNKTGGTGLGLTICKSLVEMLGGNIWAESEIGKGSTFYFSLPLETTK